MTPIFRLLFKLSYCHFAQTFFRNCHQLNHHRNCTTVTHRRSCFVVCIQLSALLTRCFVVYIQYVCTAYILLPLASVVYDFCLFLVNHDFYIALQFYPTSTIFPVFSLSLTWGDAAFMIDTSLSLELFLPRHWGQINNQGRNFLPTNCTKYFIPTPVIERSFDFFFPHFYFF